MKYKVKIRRFAISFLFLLVASIVTEAQRDRQVAEQSSAPLTVMLDRGLLGVKTPLGAALSNMKLRLRLSPDSALLGELVFAERDTGTDKGGKYERLRYRFKPGPSSQAAPKDSVSATLEVRHYPEREVIIAWLDYEGPPLARRDGIQLLMGLDRFARGMAAKRFKLYWTSPVFVSDYRLLSPANQLLLWRQLEGNNYHLLIPLAGDGFISEVGVSEIDYRPEFRISSSSYDPNFSPRRVPLFAYATSNDPYKLPMETYEVAFSASDQYGRLRWQKSYPEIFTWLGWCSWNAYGPEVTEKKILSSIQSFKDKKIPIGFVLVDDGWLSTKDSKLTAFNADQKKFPGGLSGLARSLREQYHIPHVGVWHTFQGYWSGVDPNSEIARSHNLFKGVEGKALPDPRDGAGESFYREWYRLLKEWGFDFVKVDGQGNNVKFTDGLMPLFISGGGEHRNFQEAAQKYFSDAPAENNGRSIGLNVINCMEMSLENSYNWSLSNVARNSDDYLPDNPQNAKEHIYQNAYNAYWISNFAYPDWDMFQSHDPHAEFHAVARAISGGPIYITDEPGKENPAILRPLASLDGRLFRLDQPAQVTRDILLTDVALEPVPLKVFGTISRPGLSTGMVAAFNVNKSAANVTGRLSEKDVEHLAVKGGNAARAIAVYRRSTGQAMRLDTRQTELPFSLSNFGFDLFTLSPIVRGVAVFGLLDKYLGPAAIVSQTMEKNGITIRLHEAGDFAAWLDSPPVRVQLDGRLLSKSSYSYVKGLLRVPRSSFGDQIGERQLRLVLASGGR